MQKAMIQRRVARLGSVDIFYRDTETNGQSILCLHGRWGRGETWVDFIQHYGDRFRVIAPDQRGHGLSSKPITKYTAAEMSDDMVGLLHHLQIGSTIVVGHSMGGYIAGYMAAQYPAMVRALAILDKSAAGPAKPDEMPPKSIDAIDPLTRDWPMPFRSLKEAQECIRAAVHSELGYEYFMNSVIETVEGYQMMFSSQAIAANITSYQDWFDILPKIKCSVLLLRAKGGDAVKDEDFIRMKTLIPDCEAYEISNPDHCVYLSNKYEFYRVFDRFLDRVLEGKRQET